MRKRVLTLLIVLTVAIPSSSNAWNYPRDGRFKQPSLENDAWFFVDDAHWDIKAPDKWQHFTG